MNIFQLLTHPHNMPGVSSTGPYAPPPSAVPAAAAAPQSARTFVLPPPPEPISVQRAPQELSFPSSRLPSAQLPDVSAQSDGAPRRKHSILDIIGRASDVLAKVGGAEALYQPTLDANTAREDAVGDHQRAVDLSKLQIDLGGQQVEAGKQSLSDHQLGLLGRGIEGVQAIVAGGGDAVKAWGVISQQLNLDPEQAAHIGAQLAVDPKGTLDGLSAALTTTAKASPSADVQTYNMLVKADPTGKLATEFITNLAAAKDKSITPYQSAQLSISRSSQGYKQRSTDRAFGEKVREFNNPKPKAGAASAANPNAVAISALSDLHDSLGDLIRDPNLQGATGLVAGRLSLTSGQREVEGRIESLRGQAIPAAIAAIKGSGGASPRAVSEIMGEVKGLIGAIDNRTMDHKDYVANIAAAQRRLTKRINELQAAPARVAPARSSGGLPPRIGAPRRAAPAATGWGKAQVIK